MKLAKMDNSQALDFLGLRIMKHDRVTQILTQSLVEITVADADAAIAENVEAITFIEHSPAAGADIWHVKAISAWLTVKSLLETEEN